MTRTEPKSITLFQKLNPWNKRASEELIAVANLTSRGVDSYALQQEIPDKKFYLGMDFNKIDNYHFNDKAFYPIVAVENPDKLFTPQMNHISLTLPHAPLLTQLDDIPEVCWFD